MVSGIPPVGVIQNERFLSYDTVLLGVRYVNIPTTDVDMERSSNPGLGRRFSHPKLVQTESENHPNLLFSCYQNSLRGGKAAGV
jgi:hypothetical protein